MKNASAIVLATCLLSACQGGGMRVDVSTPEQIEQSEEIFQTEGIVCSPELEARGQCEK